MRLVVLVAALFAAHAWASQIPAADPEAASAPSSASAVPNHAPPAPEGVRENAQDQARWFYAVLTGEIAAHTGHPGTAYSELLKAARDMHSEPLFERAVSVALGAGAPEQALAAVKAWQETLPDSLKAQIWRAQLLVAMGRGNEAATAISRVLALTPQPQRPNTILSLASLFVRAGDAHASLALAKKVLTPYRDIPQSGVVIGQFQARAGQTAEAFDHAAKALAADPGMTAAAALLLQTYAHHPQRTDQLLQGYFALKPDDTRLRMAWIEALLGQQRDGIALTQAEALSKVKPDIPEAWLILGSLQLQQDQTQRAQQTLTTFLGLIEKSQPAASPQARNRAYLALAEVARKQRDYAQAEHWLSLIPADQDALAVALQKAIILTEQNKPRAGLRLIDELPSATPQQRREQLLARAQIYRAAKQFHKAYAVLKSGLAQFGKDPDYAYETAMMAEKSGQSRAMEALLRKIIARSPRYQPAYNALGYTLADQNRHLPVALKLVTRALALAPGNPFVLDSMGWVQFRLGHLKRALSALEDAYAARQDPEIAAHLAEVLWAQGDRARARKILQEAYERAPHDEGVKAAMHRTGLRF